MVTCLLSVVRYTANYLHICRRLSQDCLKNMLKKHFISLLSLLVISGMLSGCFKETPVKYNVNLEIWGAFDDSDAFSKIFAEYQDVNPFVTNFEYKKFLVDDYKQDLLDALASGKGPDIFLIHNTWLPEFKDKIEPAPVVLLNEAMYRKNFVDVAADDFVSEGKVYGVPLSVDSLALYYNKDLLNYEGISSPPQTWDEFNEQVKKLTKINNRGEIVQAGAALGTARNINRSTDILNALFLQNGTPTADSSGRVSFGSSAENALRFYTQFADRTSLLYTWNPLMHYSVDAFSEGSAAMMINYSWQADAIKKKNARLNFTVAPLPQTSTDPRAVKANYANYWVLAVSKNKIDLESPNPQQKNMVRIFEAWEFLKYLTTQNGGSFTITNAISNATKAIPLSSDPAKLYLEFTKKPAARRDIVEEQKNDAFLGAFAYGNLIAKSWYQPSSVEVERILAEAIESIYYGNDSTYHAIELIEQRVRAFAR